MSTPYERLPLINLTAPRAIGHKDRAGSSVSDENFLHDSEDARAILKFAGLSDNLSSKNIIEAREKYLIETEPGGTAKNPSYTLSAGMRQKDGTRRPHYTKLLKFDKSLVFQAACCLPLKVVAASLDGNPVSGRILFHSHSEKEGGKLVYEFMGTGTEIIVDLKRGKSTKAQRLIFKIVD